MTSAPALIPARPGPAGAAPSLASAWVLAWRLQRGSLIGWTAGVAVGAGVFGAIAHDIEGMVANSDAARVFAETGRSTFRPGSPRSSRFHSFRGDRAQHVLQGCRSPLVSSARSAHVTASPIRKTRTCSASSYAKV